MRQSSKVSQNVFSPKFLNLLGTSTKKVDRNTARKGDSREALSGGGVILPLVSF